MVEDSVTDGPERAKKPAVSTDLRLSPEVIAAAEEDFDKLDELLGPPTSRMRRPLSQIAIRSDGVMLCSLDDADEHITEGREVQLFMVLTADEHDFVMESAKEFMDDRAARVIGRLPRRSSP